MSHLGRIGAWLLMALATAGVAWPVAAQAPQAKPHRDVQQQPKREEPLRPEIPKPAQPQPPAEAKAAASKPPQPESLEPAAPPDPAVEAILETKPSTPAECARAAKILADLHRPDLAKGLLQKVLDAKPDDKQLAELAERFGSALFLELASRQDLLPEARQLTDAVLAATTRQAQDPKRLAALVQQLQSPSAELRYQALVGLEQARSAAVNPLMAVLADPRRADEHPNVRAALVRLGSSAVGPLLGMLESPDALAVVPAMQVLAEMDARDAAIYLLGPLAREASPAEVRKAAEEALVRLLGHTPSRRQAVELLAQRARQYFQQRQPLAGAVDGQVELWHWDAQKKQCVAKSCPVDDASRAVAARLARDAYALAPNDKTTQVLYLATMLEAAAYENGLDKPLGDGPGAPAALAAKFDVDVIQNVLQEAIKEDHPAAAAAAARILGRKGTAKELLYQGDSPAPLVAATRHSDRRLRMAALEAIIRLEPQSPFPGSSYIAEALGFFAASSGARRVLVAGPSTEDSLRFSGSLAAMGYQIDTAVTGRELIRMAIASPDCELALIDTSVEQPGVEVLVQQLRHDCRTAWLPLGLIARSGYLERAERIARRDPLTLAFSRPHTPEALKWQVGQLSALAPRQLVPQAMRQQQAAQALEWLARLSKGPARFYDVRRTQDPALAALHVPTLSTKAVAVIESLGTPESQRALVDLASRWTEPLEVRKAAVEAFGRSTQQYGILLTTDEINRQYQRYNQSRSQDAATQRILGLVLDSIEAPSQVSEQTSPRHPRFPEDP